MADCYVYYRIAPERQQAARRALRSMLDELMASARIAGRAFCRAEEPLLWMEVYAGVTDPQALLELVAGLAERHGLIGCLADPQRRHAEHFVPLHLQ